MQRIPGWKLVSARSASANVLKKTSSADGASTALLWMWCRLIRPYSALGTAGTGPRWQNSQWTDIGATKVRAITAPYFLATKLEAFYGRGHDDFLGSRDIQDIIAVLDGRPELVAEVHATETELKDYLRVQFTQLLRNQSFMDAISGHLMPDDLGQERRTLIVDRLKGLAEWPGKLFDFK
jgi:hypothetical protein